MSLPSGPEIWVYAQVDLHPGVFEPSTATSSEVGRLLHFNQTEKANVEAPSRVFLARRHGQLDVIKAHDLQVSLQRTVEPLELRAAPRLAMRRSSPSIDCRAARSFHVHVRLALTVSLAVHRDSWRG